MTDWDVIKCPDCGSESDIFDVALEVGIDLRAAVGLPADFPIAPVENPRVWVSVCEDCRED